MFGSELASEHAELGSIAALMLRHPTVTPHQMLAIVGPWSSGRASAAIAPIHPSGDVIVLDQLAFSRGGPALFDLGAEPFVVVH